MNSELCRIGDGPDICRSREEFEEVYAAGFGDVIFREWPYDGCDLG